MLAPLALLNPLAAQLRALCRTHDPTRLTVVRTTPMAYIAPCALVETPVFTAAASRHLSDDRFRALQLALLLRPAQGPLVPGGAGIRKLRWGAEGRGKRGASA